MASFSLIRDASSNSSEELKTDYLAISDLFIDCVILSLIILSNSCLLALEVKIWFQRKRLSQPRFLIISLALIDTVSGVFGILPRIVLASRMACSSSTYLQFYMATRFVLSCFMILSKLTVVLMGIERFISIRAPFFYVRNCSLKTFAVVLAVLIFYALVLGSLSVFLDFELFRTMISKSKYLDDVSCHKLFLYYEFYVFSWRSSITWNYLSLANGYTVFLLMQNFVLVIVLLICNIRVIGGLHDMEKRIKQSCPRPTESRTDAIDLMTATGKEFSRLMVTINIVVLLITTPYMTRTLCNHLGILSSPTADFVCHHLVICSAFVNPFLYGLLRRKLRRRIRVFLSKWCKLCRPTDVSPIELTRATDSNMRLPKL